MKPRIGGPVFFPAFSVSSMGLMKAQGWESAVALISLVTHELIVPVNQSVQGKQQHIQEPFGDTKEGLVSCQG